MPVVHTEVVRTVEFCLLLERLSKVGTTFLEKLTGEKVN